MGKIYYSVSKETIEIRVEGHIHLKPIRVNVSLDKDAVEDLRKALTVYDSMKAEKVTKQ